MSTGLIDSAWQTSSGDLERIAKAIDDYRLDTATADAALHQVIQLSRIADALERIAETLEQGR